MTDTIEPLRARIAELEAIINETFTDENGDVWRTPSPEAYARSCIAARRQGIEEAASLVKPEEFAPGDSQFFEYYEGASQYEDGVWNGRNGAYLAIRQLLDDPASDAVLVPVEPTPEMIEAAIAANPEIDDWPVFQGFHIKVLWRAMIQARAKA